MNQFEKWLWQHKLPVTRNVWLRFLKYFLGALIISYFLYSQLSQIDLETLEPLYNKRRALAFLMLSIMSAKSWGWSSFVGMIATALWGDWQNLRWRSLPKENPVAKDGDENESDSKEGPADSKIQHF